MGARPSPIGPSSSNERVAPRAVRGAGAPAARSPDSPPAVDAVVRQPMPARRARRTALTSYDSWNGRTCNRSMSTSMKRARGGSSRSRNCPTAPGSGGTGPSPMVRLQSLELLDGGLSRHDGLVIASHAEHIQGGDGLDAHLELRPVADHVVGAEPPVDPRLPQAGDRRAQRGEVPWTSESTRSAWPMPPRPARPSRVTGPRRATSREACSGPECR